MRLLEESSNNLDTVTVRLLRKKRIKVTDSSIKNCLQDHPEYPSLLSASDCLDSWEIGNSAYKIEQDDFDKYINKLPFVVHLAEGHGKFLLIEQILDQEIVYSDEKFKKRKISKQEFWMRWGGIIFLINEDIKGAEKNYRDKRIAEVLNKLLIPSTFFLTLIILYSKIIQSQHILPLLLIFLVKALGFITSIGLLIQSLNSKNTFLQQLCSITGKNGCNSILKSSSANLTSWLSWSEVGFFYFAGSLICLAANVNSIHILAWINILAIPYTFYSLIYQFKKRSWCTLCCLIQITLWAELICFQFYFYKSGLYFNQSIYIPNSLLFSIFTAFAIPVIFWGATKPLFLAKIELLPVKQKLSKFKSNTEIFQILLQKENSYDLPLQYMPITFGKTDAKNHLVIVSNPFCRPCAKAHSEALDLLKDIPNLQVSIVFALNESQSAQSDIALSLFSVFRNCDRFKALAALDTWYGNDKYDLNEWKTKYPSNIEKIEWEILEGQKLWIKKYGIKKTPTLILNQHKVPELYDLNSLKHVLS